MKVAHYPWFRSRSPCCIPCGKGRAATKKTTSADSTRSGSLVSKWPEAFFGCKDAPDAPSSHASVRQNRGETKATTSLGRDVVPSPADARHDAVLRLRVGEVALAQAVPERWERTRLFRTPGAGRNSSHIVTNS